MVKDWEYSAVNLNILLKAGVYLNLSDILESLKRD